VGKASSDYMINFWVCNQWIHIKLFTNTNSNNIFRFKSEVEEKHDEDIYEFFLKLFDTLPLAHCLNEKVLVLHGGLFSDEKVTLQDIRDLDRKREPKQRDGMIWQSSSSESNSIFRNFERVSLE
jgi:hypothetical protein